MVKIFIITKKEEPMGQTIFQRKSVIALMLIIFLGVAWTGCSTTVQERQQGQPVTGATGEAKAEREWAGKYYLDDVRVPNELKYDSGKSFIYETPRFKAGVLRFSTWRLDVQSLIDYFTYNM